VAKRVAVFALVLLGLLYLLGHQSATATAADSNTIVLTGPVPTEALRGKIEYHLDADWSRSTAAMINASADIFQPVVGRAPDFGYTKSRIWLRLRLHNATAEQHAWRIHFRENFKQLFDVFVAYPNGEIVNTLSQDLERGFGSRSVQFPELVAPITIAPGQTVTVLIRYWSEGSSGLGFSIETAESFAITAAARIAKNFVYYGMTMLLIIIALGALPVFRHPVFLAYAAYAASSLLFLMHADGVAFQYLWPNSPHFNSVASIVTGSAIIISGSIYARVFLRTRQLHPVLDKVLWAVIAVTLAVDISCFFLDLQPLKKLLVLVATAAVLVFVLAGLIAARTRFREVRFYVLAWLGAALSAAIMTMRHWLGIDIPQDIQFDSMRIVMVFDATMMGLAIADRFSQLRQSRQRALQASLHQAERNLMLNNRLAQLEDQYSLAYRARCHKGPQHSRRRGGNR